MEDVNSLILTDASTLSSIDDATLQDALNISDNESLHNNLVLEEGIVINTEDLKLDLTKY